MKQIILLISILIFSNNCIQNLAECPIDTITLNYECQNNDRKQMHILLRTIGFISATTSSTSSDELTGRALEFYTILESYRNNGSYALTSGTTRVFLNSSSCPGKTKQNLALNRAAQKHNDNMVRLNFFSHTGQDGSTPTTRVNAEGLNVGAGENIAAEATAEATFDQWWNSAGHRANMENCNYTHVGIGYTARESVNPSATYSHYWTNVFATIP